MNNKNTLSNLANVTAGKVKTSGITAFNELVITKVYPNPNQPRKQFDDIEQLASTIKEHGLLQPITVLKKDNGYMIISGERRYKAHLYNEAKTIKAHIIDVSPEAVEELTLIENIQRNDLTDFELAKHICKLWDSGRYEKKSDLATRIGKKDSFVSKSFNCLKLDREIIDNIEQNKTPISIGVMDEIVRLKDPTVQKEVYKKYNNREITRDEIKEFKKVENFNETFHFSNVGSTKMFLRYIKKDWVFERLNNSELYELKIKEVLTFTNEIQDDESKISFVLDMTKQIKDAFKSKFDSFIDKKCGLLEIGKYYNVTIKPKEKSSTFKLKDSNTNHTLQRFEDADNDLVEQAKTFSENFPRENIEEKQKFIFTSKKTEDDHSISFEDEGVFYFVNYGSGAKKSFKLGKRYKITIEEI